MKLTVKQLRAEFGHSKRYAKTLWRNRKASLSNKRKKHGRTTHTAT